MFYVKQYGTSAQKSRGQNIGARASGISMGLNSTQATTTTPLPISSRHYNTGSTRRETMHSRRFEGMPAMAQRPRAKQASGPAIPMYGAKKK